MQFFTTTRGGSSPIVSEGYARQSKWPASSPCLSNLRAEGMSDSSEGVPTAACPCAGMSLPQNLGDEGAICQRTRNRMPLNHVSLDELDALLGREDEGLFDEEGEQYAQFLRVSPPRRYEANIESPSCCTCVRRHTYF